MRLLSASGFSLLETIVAMAIVGIAFAVLFGGMSTAARGMERIEDFDRTLETARSIMAGIDLLETVQPGDQARGTAPGGELWRVETEAFIPPTPRSPQAVIRLRLYMESRGWEIDSYKLVDTSRSASALQEQMNAILQ